MQGGRIQVRQTPERRTIRLGAPGRQTKLAKKCVDPSQRNIETAFFHRKSLHALRGKKKGNKRVSVELSTDEIFLKNRLLERHLFLFLPPPSLKAVFSLELYRLA